MARLFIIEQNALGVGGHYFAYTSCVAQAAASAGLDVTILQNHRLSAEWGVDEVHAIPAFARTWGETETAGHADWGSGNVVYEYLEAVAANPPGRGDHVLFHTLGRVELGEVLRYLASLPPTSDMPVHHILLRYDPEELRSTIIKLEPVLAKIRNAPYLEKAVRFYTDTVQLTDAYRRMARLPFKTLPIPFRQDYLVDAQAKRATQAASKRPLTFIYLGDARIEKNFHYLPDAIAALHAKYGRAGRVRFRLQCNFNTPGGEPHQLAAVQRLGQFSEDYVRLVDKPMGSAEYYQMLSDADVVLIPYSPSRYRERSSGVLVEAMAAGKPVITSRGSWMDSLVSDDHAILFDEPCELHRAIEQMILNYDHYRAGAEKLRAASLQWSSGASFVSALLEDMPSVAEDSRPNALVIMNGDAMILRNGSSQVAQAQLNYLAAAGFRTTALFLTYAQQARASEIEATVTSVLDSVRTLPMDEFHLAAPGRLAANVLAQRVARLPHAPSIDADLASSKGFDFGSDTLDALRRYPPDVIILNYITNIGVVDALGLADVPLLCEMHDIQSFQKAIYGARSVSARDLESEFNALARCDYLISLNEVETGMVEERLSSVPCRTSGIFPSAKPSSFSDIAGCVNVLELIRSTHPVHLDEATLSDLETFATIDILFVSSNHLANVSGLRWFLDEVFVPYLAPLGVTMVIAGSISDWSGWPNARGLAFVGRVEDLAPLYAATRTVVLPITEGAGSDVKSFEAMSYIRPMVATPLELRGLNAEIEGVAVSSDPRKFADTLIRLLHSAEARREARTHIARSTREIVNPARYRQVMNEAMTYLLGGRAPVAPIEALVESVPSDVEWNELVLAINSVFRDIIAGNNVSGAALEILAREAGGDLDAIVDEIVDGFVVHQTAPLLAASCELQEQVQHCIATFPGFGSYVSSLIKSAARTVDGRDRKAGELIMFFLRDLPLELITVGSVELTDQEGRVEPRLSQNIAGRAAAEFTLSSDLAADYYFATKHMRLGAVDKIEAIVASQTINFDNIVRTSTPLFDRQQFKGATPLMRPGEDMLLHVPMLGGLSRATIIVDVTIDDDGGSIEPIELQYGGRTFNSSVLIDGLPVHRFVLGPTQKNAAPFGTIDVKLRMGNAPSEVSYLAIRQVRTILVQGDFNTGIEAFDELRPVPALIDANGKLARRHQSRVRDAVKGFEYASPVSPETLRLLQQLYATPDGRHALDHEVDSVAETVAGLDVAEAQMVMQEILNPSTPSLLDGVGFVSAPSIGFSINARFPALLLEEGIICFADGRDLGLPHFDESGAALWDCPASLARSKSWYRHCEWRTSSGEPVRPTAAKVTFNVYADLQAENGKHVVIGRNLHDVEGSGGSGALCWTGPKRTTSFVIPIALLSSGEFRMFVVDFGKNGEADIAVFVNGTNVPFTIVPRNDDVPAFIKAEMPSIEGGAACVIVEVLHDKMLKPDNADPRLLGLNMNKLEFDLFLIRQSDPDASQVVAETEVG